MVFDHEYIRRVLEITESHPDSKAVRMVELAPGVVTVDHLDATIESYLDMSQWKVNKANLERGGNPLALHYIFQDKRIGVLQGVDTSGRDNYQESYEVMRAILKPTRGLIFHHEPHIVDLEVRLYQ